MSEKHPNPLTYGRCENTFTVYPRIATTIDIPCDNVGFLREVKIEELVYFMMCDTCAEWTRANVPSAEVEEVNDRE